MTTTTIAFTVPVSLVRAFEYVSDPERFSDWSENIFSSSLMKKEETFYIKIKFWIFGLRSEYKILESQYPNRFVVNFKNSVLNLRETFSLYPDPKGSDTDTKILFTSQLELSGIAKLLLPWIYPKAGERIRKDIRKLQENLSQGKVLGARNFQVIKG
ncbi:SRPBCC family protein [Leptospira langatensis]|uniref:SRPBCC family protein n=1 Tax=Leptospira langatensis TaxID=2484983 RepID=A0A5F1ZUK9_9LEPT|nr:SRPBCC family protein [Leptospira langatensis]TGJ98820.1 SRPBCC family protein [Leptospira langatensis]TGL40613.1 SRPBCC family protein [Leptospira langatensis]